MKFTPSEQVKGAIKNNKPILALESTMISSGMPYPQNVDFYNQAEALCLSLGVVPATIAIIKGTVSVGLNAEQVQHIATSKSVIKASKREIGVCIQKKLCGATTVSSTAHLAQLAGIKVFSTGGIGGVHRGYSNTLDMSQDLYALRETPLVVVCSGIKSFLNVEKTIEALETLGVTVLGYNTDCFPLFYSSRSDIKLQHSVNNINDLVGVYKRNSENKLNSSLLILNPVPESDQVPKEEIEKIIKQSVSQLQKNKIVGGKTTPYLLKSIAEKTNNKSLMTNISLAQNNIRLGAEIAKSL